MPDLSRLRRGGPWQVHTESPPDDLAGVVPSLAIVVDTRSGDVRAAGPYQDDDALFEMVVQAATDPQGGARPGRPRSIQCHPRHAALLRPAAVMLGCSVTPTTQLRVASGTLDEILGKIADLAGNPAPSLPWPTLMQAALAERPWRTLPDHVTFTLHSTDPLLHGRVVIVLGLAGEQLGFTVFPSADAHDQFVGMIGSGSIDGFSCSIVHFDPLRSLPPAAQAMAREHGHIVANMALTLARFERGAPAPFSPQQQRATYQSVEAVLEVWRRYGARLRQSRFQSSVTVHGDEEVTVETDSLLAAPDVVFTDAADVPPPPPTPTGILDDRPSLVGWFPSGLDEDETPTLLFKYEKRDALRAAAAVVDLSGLTLHQSDGLLIQGWALDQPMGVLARLAPGQVKWREIASCDVIRLMLLKGGSRRRTFSDDDTVFSEVLDVLESDGPLPDEPDQRWRDPDPEGVLRGRGWGGDMRSWPKASAVLLAFAAPVDLAAQPDPGTLAGALVEIWNAVVQADQNANPAPLEALQANPPAVLADPAALPRLISRKRRCYPRDHRVLVLDGVHTERDELALRVLWRPLHSGPLG